MKSTTILFAVGVTLLVSVGACNKKTTPTVASTEVKPAPKKIKMPTPKMIVVNDDVAKKTVDGRMYYDLNGKRYWRNNRDGKYYLYHKSMYNNDDFKPVKKN